MKITAIEAIPVSIPFTHGGPPTGFGGTEWTTLPYLIVKVDTDEGITGYGEAFGYNAIPATKTAIDTLVAPQALVSVGSGVSVSVSLSVAVSASPPPAQALMSST